MVVGTNSATLAAIKDEVTQCYSDKVGIRVADVLGTISYGRFIMERVADINICYPNNLIVHYIKR